MTKTKFKDSIAGTTIILTIICLITTLILACVYELTEEPIALAKESAANEVRFALLPNADNFEAVEGIEWPQGVSEVYQAQNGVGYVVRSEAQGFDGPVVFMIALNEASEVLAINMFEHSETPGLGTKVGDSAYLALFQGPQNPHDIDSVSGATRTSTALKNAITQAKEAVEKIKEA